MAVYVADENGNYTETTDIPQSGYALNSEKSTCSNGAISTWTSEGLLIANLTKSGTSCYLYFDKYTSLATLAKLNITSINTTIPDFSQVATTDEGVFKIEDGMYGGDSYYWRGAVENNYVKFAGICWRIVRINGDGTIRLIYDGLTCHANGTSTSESIAVGSQAYNSSSNRSEYVGYTYTEGNQRGTTTSSNLKTQTENWFNNNIIGINLDKVATGKFCNDRRINGSETWQSTGASQNYVGYSRVNEMYQPQLDCTLEDVYNLKVGAITADEVMLAGGKDENNTSFYLRNGRSYWTMSPYLWNGGTKLAYAFCVWSYGNLISASTSSVNASGSEIGIRPVINLKADVTFSSGNGTLDTPFLVD